MKQITHITLLLAVLLLSSLGAYADDSKEEATKDAPKQLEDQTNCPVMGGAIDSTIFTDIQGQRVYHCCPMCSTKMKADPDKYFNKAAEEGILFENIQTTCPVSGQKLQDKAVFADFEGRRIYFCCEKCRVTFNDDPHEFLSKMDAPTKKMGGGMVHEKTGRKGHNH